MVGRALRITRDVVRGGCRLVLEGTIDERASLEEHFRGLSGTVVIDLDKVTRITSFGVLEWRAGLACLESAGFYAFIRCRPPLVTQFNLVEGFARRGELVSFYLPYFCSSCSNEFQILVDLRHHYFVAVTREPPYARCRRCGADAEFDGLADDYLSYVGSRPRPHVPPAGYQIIDGLVGDVVETLKVRKEIDTAVTRLLLAGPVNRDARLSSALEGVEGLLIIDLGAVTSIDPEGFAQVAAAVGRLSAARCCYTRLPLALLDSFVSSFRRSLPDEGLGSVVVNEHCPKCETTGEFELTRRAITARGAEAVCSSCRSRVALHLSREVLQRLRDVLVEPDPVIGGYLGDEQAPAAAPAAGAPEGPRPGALPVHIVGESSVIREIVETLRKVAPTKATVLLRGETGTGKELFARLLHELSPRRDGPFVAINCAALPENLVESELFGHERGAFTGAAQQYVGRFERADGGTLFIDEVGDIPLSVQVKLLRALQERSIERIGSSTPIPVDIRLVAATHRPLEQLMEQGQFRQDLFFRLSVVPLAMPPLRQRPGDIWPLALHYLGEAQRTAGRTGISFSERMRRAMEEYSWPGNVRELINVVERAVALTPSYGKADVLDFAGAPAGHPPRRAEATPFAPPAAPAGQPFAPPPPPPPAAPEERADLGLKASVDEFEKQLIQDALVRAKGNRTHAARALGISRQALVLKIAKYGL